MAADIKVFSCREVIALASAAMSGVFSFAAPFFGRAKKGANNALAWDEENRIKSNRDNGVTTEYKYDPCGTRVVKKGNQGETLYVNQNYSVRDGSIVSKHVFAGNSRIVSKVSSGGVSTSAYYHSDHLGSSNMITGKQGEFKEHIEFLPHGEELCVERTNSAEPAIFRHTGAEYDSKTGLYYQGARYRDP